jgi:hypothetical protein
MERNKDLTSQRLELSRKVKVQKPDIQATIFNWHKPLKNEELEPLELIPYHLELEKEGLLKSMSEIIDMLELEEPYLVGRPKFQISDIIKSLIIMSYHSWSYRRCMHDVKMLYAQGKIKKVPSKSTLNRYANSPEVLDLLINLIPLTALYFKNSEDCLLMDSTWLSKKMYTGGYQRVANKKETPFDSTRKLQVSCFKNSKAIVCAIPTDGKSADSPHFQEMIERALEIGFNIKEVLADAGYNSKANYKFCADNNIRRVFIDFKINSNYHRSKSSLYREQLRMYKESYDVWHEHYRFRVIVEGLFSTMKRRSLNYLRSRNELAMDIELLLKCLAHNFITISRYK